MDLQASQAHCPADPCFAQMRREHFRSAHSCALWRPCRACVLPSRPLASSCHVLHTHPGLRCCVRSAAVRACARGAPWFSRLRRRSSSGPHVGCSGALCLHSGSCTFYMLLTWTPLETFLATAELRLERLRSWLPRPCWLPELRPCSLHATYAEAQAAIMPGGPARRLQGLRLAL